ncbi:WbuC family cupin fold metalloprotein [Carboxylicivirga sediminis]|uniref:WbuC family cupin fold metalloprotein n=2 Tax=Carboxylicivirga sediminis TaxID=2006564 RepID=A0A941F668_9BACT|nr:WbuC family cupin fold metalloprotein [Carboxylicivirga sediminis]
MMIIDKKLLNTLSAKAVNSVRKRMNYNFHPTPDDPLQRMLNVLNPGSYVQPHKHESPDKREAFIILSGRLLVILFDKDGHIEEHCTLDHSKGIYGIEIPPGTYHTIVALEANTCVYEVKDGPYSPDDDKHFAPWAPAEGMIPESANYLNHLLDKTKKATLS